eukprot:SAG31_NODE_1722_length_7452_cov_2.771658_9_plen_57_part_00
MQGTSTTQVPQAVVHKIRPNAVNKMHLANGKFGDYMKKHQVQSATLQVSPARTIVL